VRPWNKRVLDRKELRRLYLNERLSLAKIGKIYECDANVILRNLREYGILTRKLSEATVKVPISREQLVRWYWKDGLSMFEIADRLGCTHSAVVYKFQKLGIKSRGHLGLTPPLKLTREGMEYFYNKGLSLEKIAKIHHRSKGGMERRFNDYGLVSRGNSNRVCKYKKSDFSGNLEEKAYIIGFRLGDLNIKPRVSVIQVRCSTTHRAQIQVIRGLFSKYTTPHVWKAKRGTTEIVCLVNRSFDFLIPKEDKIPEWVLKKDSTFWSFFAGYADAEGCLGVNNVKGKYIKKTVSFQITSYDKGILSEIRECLTDFMVYAKLYMAAPAGTPVKSALAIGKRYFSRKDAWRLCVQNMESLWKLVHYWRLYSRHKEKLNRLKFAENNLRNRSLSRFRGSKSIDLSIPTLSTHPFPSQARA